MLGESPSMYFKRFHRYFTPNQLHCISIFFKLEVYPYIALSRFRLLYDLIYYSLLQCAVNGRSRITWHKNRGVRFYGNHCNSPCATSTWKLQPTNTRNSANVWKKMINYYYYENIPPTDYRRVILHIDRHHYFGVHIFKKFDISIFCNTRNIISV